MPRRRWRMGRRAQLTPAVEQYFATGWDVTPELLAVLPDQREGLWRRHVDDFLADWIAKYPGWRPAAWWTFDAPEPRFVLEGTELLLPKAEPTDWEWVWRSGFCGGRGVPAFRQVRPPGDVELPVVESTGAYLRRLGLLTPSEHAALDLEAYESEILDPFLIADDTSAAPDGALFDPAAWDWYRKQQLRWQREWAEQIAREHNLSRGEPTNP
jgi:hypothetical protein